MTALLETENKGMVGDFGFYATHIEEVNLGELPSMPLDQFCEFSAITMGEIVQHLDGMHLNTIASHVFQTALRIRDEDKRTSQLPATDTMPYHDNPFRVLADEHLVAIDGTYDVKYAEFTDFVLYVLRGGHVGWGKEGTPKEAVESLQTIVFAFEQRQEELKPPAPQPEAPPATEEVKQA